MKQLLLFLVLVQVSFAQWVNQQLPAQSEVILGLSLFYNGDAAASGWGLGPTGNISARAYYSTNFGTIWNSASLPDSARSIIDLQKTLDEDILFASGARNLTVKQNSFFDLQEEIKNAESNRDYQKLHDLRLGKSSLSMEQYRGAFFKSTDYGATWNYFGTIPDSITYLKRMAAHFAFVSFYICASMPGGDRMIVSLDTGKTWQFSTPFIPGLTLNDVAVDAGRNVFAAGQISSDTSGPIGVLLVKPFLNPDWRVSQIVGTTTFTTIDCNSDGLAVAGGLTSSLDVPNSVVYYSLGWGAIFNKADFNGNGLVINRIKCIFEPYTAMSIILADTLTSSGFIPLIMKNTPDFGDWVTSHYFLEGNTLRLYEAELLHLQKIFVSGSSAEGGVIFYNNNFQLPVELTSFSVTQTGSTMQLKWTTASETNNHGFIVERSTDNQQFYSIGFVKGAGSTQEPQEYIYTDSPDEPGTYHYRLKQTDFNGTYKYSDVVTAEFTGNINQYILEQNYPNPFNPSTRIKFSIPQQNDNKPQLVTLTVYDILGNEIAILINEEKLSGTYVVDFTAKYTSLSAGVYVYRLRAGAFSETKMMILLK